MNSVSGTILLVLLVVVCLCPRRWAVLAIMAGVFFLTQGHSVDVAGLNLWPIRFLEAAAFARVIIRRELPWSHLNRIDWTLLLVYHYAATIWILRSSEVNFRILASAVDPTLCYLALRGLIRSIEDVRWFLNGFVVLLVPFTALVVVERLTAQSPFTMVGASGELMFRNGVPRGQGTFRHAILMGSVAAAFLSLYIGLYFGDRRKLLPLLGGVLCVGLVGLSNSGGPLTSAVAVLLGWSLWAMRRRMFIVRRAIVAVIVFLLVFMSAPIRYLPFKISSIVGGAGYHRGLLMDKAWQDLGNWWFVGMGIEDTAPWIPYTHAVVGGADITNQFLAFGIKGGLFALILFIIVLSLAFKRIGHALAVGRHSEESDREREFLIWGLGVTLVVHTVSWLGVSYFDQSYAVWLLHLAAISGALQSLPSVVVGRTSTAQRSAAFARAAARSVRSWVVQDRRGSHRSVARKAALYVPRRLNRRMKAEH